MKARLRVLEWGVVFIVTEDRRAWPLTDHKKTFTLHVDGHVYLQPI